MLVLKEFGYTFEPRGYVMVKGKGNLMTYFLTGRDANLTSQTNVTVALPNQLTL